MHFLTQFHRYKDKQIKYKKKSGNDVQHTFLRYSPLSRCCFRSSSSTSVSIHKRCCNSCGDRGAEVSLVGPAIALIALLLVLITSLACVVVVVKGTLLVTPTAVPVVVPGVIRLLFRLLPTVLEHEAVRDRLVCWSASSLSVTSFVLVRNCVSVFTCRKI